MPAVVVSAWVGAGNLGDELLLRRLLERLRAAGADEITVVSLDPDATRRQHDVPAIDARAIHRVAGAIRRADLVVAGPGGLLQDHSSPFNLPYQLHRSVIGRAVRTPVLGMGLGADPMRRRGSGALLRLGLGASVAVAVRDEPSRVALATHRVEATTTADLALATPSPEPATPSDTVVVSLRPWRPGGRVPVRWQRHRLVDAQIEATAAALDEIAATQSLAVRFVAFEPDTDHPLHEAIAARLHARSECVVPTLDGLIDTVADSQAVVATRYHAGIVGLVADRPIAAIGYAPKVQTLAADLDGALPIVSDDADGLDRLPAAVASARGGDPALRRAGLAGLRSREAANAALIERALAG